MKFTVAVGFLPQILVASDKTRDKVPVPTPLEQKFDLESILSSVSVPGKADKSIERTHDDVKYCDPSSKDPDIGILSCKHGSFCKRSEESSMGGICTTNQSSTLGLMKSHRKRHGLKNIKKAPPVTALANVECKLMTSPDTGILSCRKGQDCVPSNSSSLGGLCLESASPRRLYQSTIYYGLCNPDSENYMYYECDCSGYDLTTGTGVIVCPAFEDYCLGELYSGCDEICATRNVSYSFTNFTAPGYKLCGETVAPNTQKVCLEKYFETDLCALTFNDQPCASCTSSLVDGYLYFSFDCTNTGGIAGDTFYALQILPLVDACYIVPSNFTCNICDGPLGYPDTLVSLSGLEFQCSVFEENMNETQCATAIPLLAPTCCAAGNQLATEPGSDTQPEAQAQPSSGISSIPLSNSIGLLVGLVVAGAWEFVMT